MSVPGICLDLDLDLGDKSPVSEQEKCPRESCSQSKTEIATATSKVDDKRSLLFWIIRGSFGCETLEENASNVLDLLPFSPASVIVEEGEGERFTCFLISSLVWFWPAKLFKLFVGLRLTYHPSLHLLLKFAFELFLSCFFSLISFVYPRKMKQNIKNYILIQIWQQQNIIIVQLSHCTAVLSIDCTDT